MSNHTASNVLFTSQHEIIHVSFLYLHLFVHVCVCQLLWCAKFEIVLVSSEHSLHIQKYCAICKGAARCYSVFDYSKQALCSSEKTIRFHE